MFLTTEPNLVGRAYRPLRVLFGIGYEFQSGSSEHKIIQSWYAAMASALQQLEAQAVGLGADGVIGVHFSISETSSYFYAAVMGTAIKF